MSPSRLPPWSVPFAILAVLVPAVAGFALGGPPVGVAVGAAAVAVLAFIAVRAKPRGRLEVVGAGEGSPVLVFAFAPLESPSTIDRLVEIARRPDEHGDEPAVLVVAPAGSSRLRRWLSDLDPGRFDAQRVLAVSIASLGKAGIEAEGRVGDEDPMLAVEDALRVHGAREVVFVVADRGTGGGLIEEVRSRLDRELTVIEAGREPRPDEEA